MCNCDTGLTSDDVERLKAPLPLDGHSVRVADDDAESANFLCYAEEEPVIDRLNEIDPQWSWEITRIEKTQKHVTIYGTLTVKGVSRACVGGGSAKREGGLTDDDEKGAATDAIKRGARLFGIGIYLKQAPRIRTKWAKVKPDMDYETKKKAWAVQDAAKQEAWKKFSDWYTKTFSKPAPVAKQTPQQQMNIRAERGIVPPQKPAQPEPELPAQPSELDAHFGPRGASVDPTPEPDDPPRTENPVGAAAGSGYDPATDTSPFTSTKFDALRIHLKKIGRTTAHGHGTNAVLLAMVEAEMITEDERGGKKDEKPIQWAVIYGKHTVAQVWAAVEKHYAAEPVGIAS